MSRKSSSAPTPTRRQRRISMIIAASGTIIEWFDYSLFFYLSTALSTTFYPDTDGSLLIVLATGAAGFVFRPLGAVVFGHIGDTYGRKTALVMSAMLMSVAMLGIALIPGHSTLGIWGGIGVLILRALAGFAVGAEYTGIMVYLMESANPRRRGFTASWASANSEIGALLAVGSAASTTLIVGSDALNEWAWRIPFLLGAFLTAGLIPCRHYMLESPAFRASHASHKDSYAAPLRYALRHQRQSIIVTFLISMVGSSIYFLTITYLPVYVETTHGESTQQALNFGVLSTLSAILATPFFGLISDRYGRRTALRTVLFLVLGSTIPGYWMVSADTPGITTFAFAILASPAAGWSAVAAAAVPEQFTLRGRYSGMAIGYNMATVLFGGLTPPIVAWLTETTGNSLTPAYYATIITLLGGIPAILLMIERSTSTPSRK